MVFWSPSHYCTCGYTTSGLEECDWGVGYSLLIVILCGNSSGSKILLGEGGDVELRARTSKQISVFGFVYLCLLLSIHLFLYCRSILSQQDCIAHPNSYLEESRGRSSKSFTGYTTSNLILSDRCIISFLICVLLGYWLALHLFTPL